MFVCAHRQLVALLLSTALFGGCAASTRGSWATRFVQPGTPSVDLGGPAPEASDVRDANSQALKATAPASPPATGGLSVEDFDKRLSAAILLERLWPTAENHLRVAEEYRRLGILDASAHHIDQALRVAPRFADAHEAMARIWRDWGMPDRGLGAAYRATSYAPHSASAQNTLGTLLAALGNADAASGAYQQALLLDPASVWAQNNLCDLERQRGRLHEAQERCEAALAIDPRFARAHNNLALTFAALGDLERARIEFLAGGDEASANYNMGLVHMADGAYASAADAFEAAIRSRPTFTAAKTRAHMLRLYLLTGGK
jgi:tetratricopeptide (TPR) repeat protein